MRGTPDVGGIFPLSVEPAEGYGVDPLTRSGKTVITHTNRKFIQVLDDGHRFVSDRKEATHFDNYAQASLTAANLIEQEERKRGKEATYFDNYAQASLTAANLIEQEKCKRGKEATHFDNYAHASLAAADLIEQEERKRGKEVELVD
jgi:predicted DNA-binding WGR domain protein